MINSIAVVEFKRPQRDDYDNSENPLNLEGYVRSPVRG